MRSSAKYVGLDVHQATTLATVRQSSGKIIASSILPTEEAALLEFIAGMKARRRSGFTTCSHPGWTRRSWLDRLPDRGCRFRAEVLAAELDVHRV